MTHLDDDMEDEGLLTGTNIEDEKILDEENSAFLIMDDFERRDSDDDSELEELNFGDID